MLVRTLDEIGSAQAAGKTEIVANEGACTSLATQCFRFHDDCSQAFGRGRYGSSQTGRASTDDCEVARLLISGGLDAKGGSNLDVGRLDERGGLARRRHLGSYAWAPSRRLATERRR